jgi:oxygen-dependent protoporphyrinogen oxidase
MIAVLGGGISGLTIANELKKAGKEFILLEADSEVGGKIKSKQQNGYTFELGPNTVLINNPEIKKLLDELGLTHELIKPDEQAVKNRFVLYNGKMEALPSGPGSLFTSKLISLRTIFRVLCEPLKKPFPSNQEESLADFTRRRLGNQIYENFVYPFVTGIYAGNPEQMSMDYTLKILKEAEQEHGSILKGMVKIMKVKKAENEAANFPKQKIFTFKEGLQTLPLRLAKEFKNEITSSAHISKIIKQNNSYIIEYNKDGKTNLIEVDEIISTIPSINLTKLISWDSDFCNSLTKIEYVPAFLSHFAFDKKDISTPEKAFGLLGREHEKAPFLGILFNSKFFPHSAPNNKELITVISGGYKQKEFLKLKPEEIQEKVLNSLSKLFNISSKPEFEHFYSWTSGIPQFEMGHRNIVSSMKQFEEKNKGFYILGNFRDGISVSDCIANGVKFVNQYMN